MYRKLQKEERIKSVGANIPDRDRWKNLRNMKKEWQKQNYSKRNNNRRTEKKI